MVVDALRAAMLSRLGGDPGATKSLERLMVCLAHHQSDGSGELWSGFEAARRAVLVAAARGDACPLVLVFGIHPQERVLAEELAASVLAHPAIQYLPLSRAADTRVVTEAVAAASTGTASPMPIAFQKGSLDALRKALTAVAHCMQNVAPAVRSWMDEVQQEGVAALPQPIPRFARADQRETLERLALFEPLVRALAADAPPLQDIIEQWHAVERAWQDLQADAERCSIDGSSQGLWARLQAVSETVDHVISKVQQVEARLPPPMQGQNV
jgi:hypothetical protein